jgi:hypothetical protein
MIIGLSFTVYSFVSGNPVTGDEEKLINYLLTLTLGTGAIGAAKKGHELYLSYKPKLA